MEVVGPGGKPPTRTKEVETEVQVAVILTTEAEVQLRQVGVYKPEQTLRPHWNWVMTALDFYASTLQEGVGVEVGAQVRGPRKQNLPMVEMG